MAVRCQSACHIMRAMYYRRCKLHRAICCAHALPSNTTARVASDNGTSTCRYLHVLVNSWVLIDQCTRDQVERHVRQLARSLGALIGWPPIAAVHHSRQGLHRCRQLDRYKTQMLACRDIFQRIRLCLTNVAISHGHMTCVDCQHAHSMHASQFMHVHVIRSKAGEATFTPFQHLQAHRCSIGQSR